eukprot:TRINITY_DN23882_c0_g1_i1.p1 TRINITY_DN23882_c0_g1~~TRINITY_DN23882_c0_g1_i1.p1  ORF type:complete len:400 (-),score=56.67 TRINITY_DN23882_c0_g1_i1:594-1793(-)
MAADSAEASCVVPPGATAGKSVLCITLDDGKQLKAVVPQEASQGDILTFRRVDDQWQCSLTRKQRQHGSENSGQERRAIKLLVPKRAVPAWTTLHVQTSSATATSCCSAGGALEVVVPETAKAGNVLCLAPCSEGGWTCEVLQDQFLNGCNDYKDVDILCDVPEGVTPGETRLEVEGSIPGESIRFLVPRSAQIGNRLAVSRTAEDDVVVRILAIWDSYAPVRPVAMDLDTSLAFTGLAKLFTSLGAFVSPKLRRGSVAPHGIPGVIAAADIEDGETLLKIPGKLIMSSKSLASAMPGLYEAVSRLPGLSGTLGPAACMAACICQLIAACDKSNVDDVDSADEGCSEAKAWRSYAQMLVSCRGDQSSALAWLKSQGSNVPSFLLTLMIGSKSATTVVRD